MEERNLTQRSEETSYQDRMEELQRWAGSTPCASPPTAPRRTTSGVWSSPSSTAWAPGRTAARAWADSEGSACCHVCSRYAASAPSSLRCIAGESRCLPVLTPCRGGTHRKKTPPVFCWQKTGGIFLFSDGLYGSAGGGIGQGLPAVSTAQNGGKTKEYPFPGPLAEAGQTPHPHDGPWVPSEIFSRTAWRNRPAALEKI